MIEKVIYDNGGSKVTPTFDGDMVGITQEIHGVGFFEVYINEEELEEIFKFVKGK